MPTTTESGRLLRSNGPSAHYRHATPIDPDEAPRLTCPFTDMLTRPASPGRAQGLRTLAASIVLGTVVLIVLVHTGGLDGLSKAAGYNAKSGGGFASFQKYLDGLQDAIIPLSIPAATLGLIGGGIAYLIGSQFAQKLLGGVIIGLGLVLLSPELIK